MRVIVVGAGEVGSNIAAGLADSHDVVIVDRDGDRVDSLNYALDVLAIEGDGTSLSTLREADVEAADILIASTDNDESNIVICSTAKTVSDAFTIARVKNTELLNTWQLSRRALGVDFMVCTNLLAAEAIVRLIGLPAARDVDPFAGGHVQMAEFEIPEGSPVAAQTVRQADRFDALTFAAVLRNGDVEIPTGETTLHAGDKVVVIGVPDSVRAFAGALSPEAVFEAPNEVVIVGGSAIGYEVAKLLEDRNFKPRLIERDPERARELAEELPQTTVLQNDATDVTFLASEHVDQADVVVSALETDEKNLLVSLLTRRLGAGRTVAVVDTGQYVDLFETVGVDVAVNPRVVTAEEITRFTREQRAENVALIESDKAEVLEIEIEADSEIANRTIREAVADLPTGVVFGAITREGEYVTPRGDTRVLPGDHVVVFVDVDAASEVMTKL